MMASKEPTRGTTKAGAYPFMSKAEVRSRVLSGDRAFIAACLRIMVERTAERTSGKAPRAQRWGWGSADAAAAASALAERILSGKPGYGDQKKAVALLARYTVQVAEALRLALMKEKPQLVATANVYGVAPKRRR